MANTEKKQKYKASMFLKIVIAIALSTVVITTIYNIPDRSTEIAISSAVKEMKPFVTFRKAQSVKRINQAFNVLRLKGDSSLVMVDGVRTLNEIKTPNTNFIRLHYLTTKGSLDKAIALLPNEKMDLLAIEKYFLEYNYKYVADQTDPLKFIQSKGAKESPACCAPLALVFKMLLDKNGYETKYVAVSKDKYLDHVIIKIKTGNQWGYVEPQSVLYKQTRLHYIIPKETLEKYEKYKIEEIMQ